MGAVGACGCHTGVSRRVTPGTLRNSPTASPRRGGASAFPPRIVGAGRYDPGHTTWGKNMRRTAAVLLALLLAGAATGCGSSGQSAASHPSASATPSADPLVKFTRAVDGAQLESYATGIPVAEELGVFPPRWCKALDDGHSVEWLLGAGGLYPVGQDWGTEKADAYQLVLLGVRAYCPKHETAVKGELRALGAY